MSDAFQFVSRCLGFAWFIHGIHFFPHDVPIKRFVSHLYLWTISFYYPQCRLLKSAKKTIKLIKLKWLWHKPPFFMVKPPTFQLHFSYYPPIFQLFFMVPPVFSMVTPFVLAKPSAIELPSPSCKHHQLQLHDGTGHDPFDGTGPQQRPGLKVSRYQDIDSYECVPCVYICIYIYVHV